MSLLASLDDNALHDSPPPLLLLKSPVTTTTTAGHNSRPRRLSLSFLSNRDRSTNNNNKQHSHNAPRSELVRAGSVEVNIQLPSSDDNVGHDDGDALNNFQDETDDESGPEPSCPSPMLPTPPTSQSPSKQTNKTVRPSLCSLARLEIWH